MSASSWLRSSCCFAEGPSVIARSRKGAHTCNLKSKGE